MKKINVGIIGATGYAGVELVRLLLLHPEVNLAAVSSVSYEGKKISDVYPNLKDICDFTLENEDIIDKCDVVFTSLPHGLSEKFAKKCLEKNVKLIDLGADFRLDSAEEYERLKDSYVLDTEKLKPAKSDMIVLHPLPRVNEISVEVDSDPRAAYFRQVQYGVYVRMALIMTLLEVEKPC